MPEPSASHPPTGDALVEVGTCPFCGSADLTTAFEHVRDRLRVSQADWTYLRCGRCRSLVLSPRPHARDLAALYPPAYTAASRAPLTGGVLASAIAAAEAVFFSVQYREQFHSVAGVTASTGSGAPSLLDVGCGDGRRLMRFRRLGMEVAGADFRTETAEEVRAAGIPVYECDIQKLDAAIAPGSFDVITAFYMLEHSADPERMLHACWNVLRPGGWLAAAVPLAASCQETWFGRRWSQVVEAPRHTTLPSTQGMLALLHTTGFTDVRRTNESTALRGAMVALSLVPGGTAALVAGEPTTRRLAYRALAGAALVPGLGFALAETHLAPGPGSAVFLARRPAV